MLEGRGHVIKFVTRYSAAFCLRPPRRHDRRDLGSDLAVVVQDVEAAMPSALRSCQCRAVNQMPDESLLTVGVECYAGHRGEQTPRTLILGDRRFAVAEVLAAWLAPDYRYFKLKGADGKTYLVRHDERADIWELTMFRAEHAACGMI